MEQLPKIVREQLRATAGGDHLDPDLLTAFAEQALPERERSGVLLHLSQCAECRDVLALAVPAATATTALDTARPVSWFQWRVLRWGAAAACVVIVGSAVLLKRDTFRMQSAKTAAVSEERQAEQLAYEKVDRPSPASPEARRQESIPAATPAANEVASEKDMGRTREKALRLVSPKSTAAPSAPPAPLPAKPRQAIAGGERGAAASGGALGVLTGSVPDGDQTIARVDEVRKSGAELKADVAAFGKVTETIDAEAPAPAAQSESSTDKRETVGKAKTPASAMLDSSAASVTLAQNQAARTQETVGQKMDRAKLHHSPVSRWTISSDGQLQHSIDSGQTWQPVAVAEKAIFRALSANGPDVWVGGAAGLLYHTSNAGANWTQVKPASGDSALQSDISAIEFTDLLHGKITTSSGEAWSTEDGGQNWRVSPR